jgi:hypothetical protein
MTPAAQHRGAAPPIQRKVSANGSAIALPPQVISLAQLGGQPLPEAVRQKMEQVFGARFGDVRVHVGTQAAALGAHAFTQGSHIHFAPGRYDPTSPHGQRMLGHELAHVVQQRAGRARNPFGSGVAVVHDSALEAEAERLSLRIATIPSRPPLPTVQRTVSLPSGQRAAAHAGGVAQPGLKGALAGLVSGVWSTWNFGWPAVIAGGLAGGIAGYFAGDMVSAKVSPFQPTGARKDNASTQAALEGLRDDKVISGASLMGVIPAGTRDVWKPEARLKVGFRFEWKDSSGKDWHVHGHEPDPSRSGTSSNAANHWTVRIYNGDGEYLLNERFDCSQKKTGEWKDWSKSKAHIARTHIKLAA